MTDLRGDEDGTYSETDTAKIMGVSNPTLRTWALAKGCPHIVQPNGRRRYRLPEVREYRRKKGREPKAPKVKSKPKTQRSKDERAAERAVKSLIRRIKGAKTYDHLKELSLEVAGMVIAGEIGSGPGNAASTAIREARQCIKATAEEDTDEQEEQLVPVSEDAVEVALLFQGIIDDHARSAALAYMHQAANSDKATNPNVDTARDSSA